MLPVLLSLTLALPPADTLTFSGRAGQLAVAPPRLDEADVRIDGRLQEEAWERAAVLRDFTQYEPVEGIDAREPTEVRVFYTDEAIYFGIHAYDSDPSQILARLGERDRVVFGDDWVRIMLDTFDDQRQAYVFYVNPLGLQTDGLWIEGLRRFGRGGGGVSIDFNPDFIWESDGHVTEDGWVAEVRIPYVSLRFREVPEQSWGIQVAREVKRRGFKQAWAPLTKDNPSTLAQSGRLVGLRGLHPRRLVEWNPVATGSRNGAVSDGVFTRENPAGEFGLNARVGVTRNLVLDATYNPDFSQVEADANRITVNERFALFFPEKRTFFLEGAEIFNTPARLVYTRRIIDPIAGAKLSGKVGAVNVGYIGAVDESPRSLGSGSGNAVFNLLRARRDVGRGSTLGLLYADRTMRDGGGAYNRVFAGDARLVFGRYTLTAQLAGSLTRAEGAAGHSGLQPLLHAQLQRSSRSFSWDVRLTDVAPDFRAASGFIQRVGDAEVNASVSYTHYGRPGALLERTSVRVNTSNFFTHDGLWGGERPFEHEVEVWPTLFFRGGRILTLVLRNGYFRFEPESYASYGLLGPDGESLPFQVPSSLRNMKAMGVLPRLRLTNESNLNGMFFFREVPIFGEASRGFEVQAGPSLDLRPTDRLQLSLNHTFSRIWRRTPVSEFVTRDAGAFGPAGATRVAFTREVDNGSPYSTVNLSRLRLQYQFTKALFARGIVQYQLEERDALTDPTTGLPITIGGYAVPARRSGEFQGQFLLQYQPSPGTIFYIGYSRLMRGDALSYRLGRMDPVEDGLFLKLSYLFRM